MPTFRDTAICIRHWDWSETSQTVSLLTREHGMLRGLAKGAKRENSRFCGGIELLTRGQIVWIAKPNAELATLTEWDLSELYPGIRATLACYYAGMYAADLCRLAVRDHDPHPGLFDALHHALTVLAPDTAQTTLARFQWELLVEAGYRPELTRDVRTSAELAGKSNTWFYPRLGGFSTLGESDATTGEAWGVRAETLGVLRQLATGTPPDGGEPASERAGRLMAAYVREALGVEASSLRYVYSVPNARNLRGGS